MIIAIWGFIGMLLGLGSLLFWIVGGPVLAFDAGLVLVAVGFLAIVVSILRGLYRVIASALRPQDPKC